jgi:hypothetical protein
MSPCSVKIVSNLILEYYIRSNPTYCQKKRITTSSLTRELFTILTLTSRVGVLPQVSFVNLLIQATFKRVVYREPEDQLRAIRTLKQKNNQRKKSWITI